MQTRMQHAKRHVGMSVNLRPHLKSLIHQRVHGLARSPGGSRSSLAMRNASNPADAQNFGQSTLYLAKSPLAGLSQLTRLLPPSQLPAEICHWMVIIQENQGYTVLDFLPEDPLAFQTALTLVSGQQVKGAPCLRQTGLPQLRMAWSIPRNS